MEELLLSDSFYIRVCDNGKRLKVKDNQEKDLLIARAYTKGSDCCTESVEEPRFQIFDTSQNLLWQVEGDLPEDCCGGTDTSGRVSMVVQGLGGAVLGLYEGKYGSYSVLTQSRDRLFTLEKKSLSSTHKIWAVGDPNVEGKLSVKFTLFSNLTTQLTLPPGLPLDRRVLLLAVALEFTSMYRLKQQNSASASSAAASTAAM